MAKIPIFNREYIFKRSIFHCHVSLLEGRVIKEELWFNFFFFRGVLCRQIALKGKHKSHSFQVKDDTAAGCNIEASKKEKAAILTNQWTAMRKKQLWEKTAGRYRHWSDNYTRDYVLLLATWKKTHGTDSSVGKLTDSNDFNGIFCSLAFCCKKFHQFSPQRVWFFRHVTPPVSVLGAGWDLLGGNGSTAGAGEMTVVVINILSVTLTPETDMNRPS